ncbi:MAG TPA: Gfo/Idh/MocA family oxidoreductase [Planctomycetota bacterium]|nr:Gfo/Idh/MocA family oxidoreductase [Planctomycetota bacterium]
MLSRRRVLQSALLAWPAVHAWPQEPKKTYRACIIGHTGRGNYGHGMDTTFQRLPHVRVVAVADPDEKGRAGAQKRSGAERAYADWREMLSKEKPDLVSNGPRWVEGRLEVFTACARIGASVYSEKPLAASPAEADAIVDVCRRHKVKTALAHQNRLAPQVLHAQRAVDEGLIGELKEIRTFGKEDRRSGGEDLMVLGTHALYLMRLFGGPATSCTAKVTLGGRPITREDRRKATEPLGPVAGDSIEATYALPKGVVGTFTSLKQPKPGGRFGVTLVGTKGTVQIGPANLCKATMNGEPLPGAPPLDDPCGLPWPAAANYRLVEDLIRAIETDGESVASAEESRAVLDMIFATYASQLAGGPVTLPLADRTHPLGEL